MIVIVLIRFYGSMLISLLLAVVMIMRVRISGKASGG